VAKLIFKLRDVSIDELSEVRALLEDHEIDIYETQGGLFGMSLPGLWVSNDDQYEQARELLDNYAEERQLQIRAEAPKRFSDHIWQSPLTTLMSLVSILLILFFSIWPFIRVGGE